MQGLEWIVLLVAIVVLFAFGGKKIPELARSLGRAKGEFERGKRELERELREEEYRPEGTKSERESDVAKAAKDLGIDIKGKTEEELKEEIKEKLK
ncbi:MAG: twin-arginine translocase TatA/TatE family subunit [Thermoplasmata archaeon]